jgi:hypothetical protein
VHGTPRTPARRFPAGLLMRSIAVLTCLFCSGAAPATTAELSAERPVDRQEEGHNIPPPGVRLFDLHDPGLMSSWPGFLATTPMQNDELLPPSLQSRMTKVVETYQALTPVGQPAFFVATYFDLLSERLLAGAEHESNIFPMQVCPVFASGSDAAVSSLLAVASGLPDALFVNAPGQPERYRFLFLQTEYSHCRFLATVRAPEKFHLPAEAGEQADTVIASLSFNVGMRTYTANLGTKQELRALVEAVGEVDAINKFTQQMPSRSATDEAEVLRFTRLLSLLATDGKSGYAAIPVLLPLLSEGADEHPTAETRSVPVADALDLAYRVREAFRLIVPFPIRDTNELLRAKLAVTQALAAGGEYLAGDERITSLLDQFVIGSDLLLAAAIEKQAIAQ